MSQDAQRVPSTTNLEAALKMIPERIILRTAGALAVYDGDEPLGVAETHCAIMLMDSERSCPGKMSFGSCTARL